MLKSPALLEAKIPASKHLLASDLHDTRISLPIHSWGSLRCRLELLSVSSSTVEPVPRRNGNSSKLESKHYRMFQGYALDVAVCLSYRLV